MIGDAALGIWMDVDPAGLDDFNAWYRRQHLPERLSVPGFLRGRRYQTTGEGPVYFTLYETADAAVLSSAAYLERLNNPTDWTRRALPRIRARVAADLARPGLPRATVLAAVVRLLDTTLIRVGNEAYARQNHSFGLTTMRDRHVAVSGGILTFRSDHPKWSYARTDHEGRVTEVAEKVVISDQATVGIYYFRHGSDFVRFAKQMIAKDIRVNGEFYVCPVFNQLIQAGLDVYVSEISPSQMHGLGTPEDLEKVLRERPAVKEVVLARAAEPEEQERVRAVVRAAGARLLLAPTAMTFTEI